MFKKNINKKSRIVIGVKKENKQNKYLLSDKKRVLFIDKLQNLDFLNVNIRFLSKFRNKPILFVVDSNYELYTINNQYLKEQGYKIFIIDLDKINFNVLDVINQLFLEIKQLEEDVHNNLGKYFLNNETYLSYSEIRKKINNFKSQIITMIDEIIYTFYHYGKLSKNLILLRCIFLRILEEWWDDNNKNTLEMKMLLEKTIHILNKSTYSIKKYLFKSYDDDFKIKETIEKVKIKKDEWEHYVKDINDASINLIPKFLSEESILLEQKINSKQTFFIHGKNNNLLELLISFLKYCDLSTDGYLLINNDDMFLNTIENLKVLWVVNQIKENQKYDEFELKVFRGNPINDNKKELLLICKNQINGLLTKEYEKVFNLLKKIDSLNAENGEVLVIDDRQGYLKTRFITDAMCQNIALHEKVLIKKYKEI